MKSCKKIKASLLLYGITNRNWLKKGETLYEKCEEALKGGVTMLQFREKNLNEETFCTEAIELKKLCTSYEVPLIINDNIDVFMKSDADGIHVGQDDMCPGSIRELIGEDKILGVSVQTLKQGLKAEREGADYLGVGAIFPTETKGDAKEVSLETLKEICEGVNIPVVAIGGITKNNLKKLEGSNVDGVAVISEIFAASNIYEETKKLYKVLKGTKF